MTRPPTTLKGIPQAHRVICRRDRIDLWPATAMVGLLDREPSKVNLGDRLPLGWHWLYFRSVVPISHLAVDGHIPRGGFMPETDLPRRMWAGGVLRERSPVRIGREAELRSFVREAKEKRGKRGRLLFVTIGQELRQDGRLCVEEDQVIVYREAGSARAETSANSGANAAAGPRAAPLSPPPPLWSEIFLPTPVTLFQFSALTWNSHRIHYDHRYVTGREDYPGLLVHGPLTALLLLDAARRRSSARIVRFRYRALAPLFVDRPIELVGRGAAEAGQGAADGEEGPVEGGGAEGGGRGEGGRGEGRRGEGRRGDPASGKHLASGEERVVEALGPRGTVAMRGWARQDPVSAATRPAPQNRAARSGD